MSLEKGYATSARNFYLCCFERLRPIAVMCDHCCELLRDLCPVLCNTQAHQEYWYSEVVCVASNTDTKSVVCMIVLCIGQCSISCRSLFVCFMVGRRHFALWTSDFSFHQTGTRNV